MEVDVVHRQANEGYRSRASEQSVTTQNCFFSESVVVSGKYFRCGADPFFVKGLSYGPFAANRAGEPLPERFQVREDLRHVRRLGGNTIRVYHLPPQWLLDEAAACGVRVFIDVPWEKHRCFLEDWSSQKDALGRVKSTARQFGRNRAMFAISVGNEIPHDVVRFYGSRRIARFIDELVDAARQEQPSCLLTYATYPPAEFLSPSRLDFYCANVYLHDPQRLAQYLDRLHHVAGDVPVILGEHGADSMREGRAWQAQTVGQQVRQVFRRGLAGSIVFSYTDDWFTGGHQIDDWAFGLTDVARREKPVAKEVSEVWAAAPLDPAISKSSLPKVSVIVCSYNGANTLEECLDSLARIDYPDYEVVLVDDGSTDNTREIAERCERRMPQLRYVHQENRGLSAARNVGAELAKGEIVAYTDSDCVADPHWLYRLVVGMQDLKVEAIGGPNIPPAADNWVGKCVAASPGGPSHVMLDDRYSEHVPGCNMAFRRQTLLDLGGFDPQFRQAGDDVDVCWRFLDAGLKIGFAAGAFVWHHRRHSLRGFYTQQRGYGRSEAMLQFKHPNRFNALGCSRWNGVIYGAMAVGLKNHDNLVYHGQFGFGTFQTIYRETRYGPTAYFVLLEWYLLLGLVALLGVAWHPLWALGGGMGVFSLVAAGLSSRRGTLPANHPRWCKPLVFVLHLLQPSIRSWHRYAYRFARKRSARPALVPIGLPAAKRISWNVRDVYWNSTAARGREELLQELVNTAAANNWPGDFQAEWAMHDVELIGGLWQDVRLRTATEELGWPRRFTRVRCTMRSTVLAQSVAAVIAIVGAAAAARWHLVGSIAAASVLGIFALVRLISRRRVWRDVFVLIDRAGHTAGLEPVANWNPTAPASPATERGEPSSEELSPRLAQVH